MWGSPLRSPSDALSPDAPLQLEDGAVIDARTWDLPVQQQYSFGRGDDGEIYLLLEAGSVLKLIAR